MTNGEKMIWAAEFVRRYNEASSNSLSDKYAIASAIESAERLVTRLREAKVALFKEHGSKSNCYTCYTKMLED